MPDYATKDEVREIVHTAIQTDVRQIVTEAVDELARIVATAFQEMDGRMNTRFDRLEDDFKKSNRVQRQHSVDLMELKAAQNQR